MVKMVKMVKHFHPVQIRKFRFHPPESQILAREWMKMLHHLHHLHQTGQFNPPRYRKTTEAKKEAQRLTAPPVFGLPAPASPPDTPASL
jgi:hypothetical protein